MTNESDDAPRWLDRELIAGPRLMLVLSENEYIDAMNPFPLSATTREEWAPERGARTHHVVDDGTTHCVVCMRDWADAKGIQVAALLCHEAVHVFQRHCADIGEDCPSAEFEAWSIQAIAQSLMLEYVRRTFGVCP